MKTFQGLFNLLKFSNCQSNFYLPLNDPVIRVRIGDTPTYRQTEKKEGKDDQ
jgi:hypothetical protein